jgi:hypothetical protein
MYAKVVDNIEGSSSSYTSPVWKFFERDPKNDTKAKCKICASFHNRSGSSTSNLIKVSHVLIRNCVFLLTLSFNWLF